MKIKKTLGVIGMGLILTACSTPVPPLPKTIEIVSPPAECQGELKYEHDSRTDKCFAKAGGDLEEVTCDSALLDLIKTCKGWW